MKIVLTPNDFTTDATYFYSPPFKQGKIDDTMAVNLELTSTGELTIQTSINETQWSDIVDSTVDCDTITTQIYAGGHPDLFYRLKTTTEPVSANVLI